MQSLDTSIVLRLLLADLPLKIDEINSFIDSQESNSLRLEDAVLFEIVWVLSRVYGLDRSIVGRSLLRISGIRQIKCNRQLLYKAVPLYIRHPKLSFVDICLSIYAEQRQAEPLLTFDKALARQLPNARLLA